MIPGRPSNPGTWLLLAGLFCCLSCRCGASTFENKTGQDEGKPRVFSPRMDYDEWTPLGRGDPLKNNPTFDYVPPVLDRVQYWLDSHTTEPSAKRDILVLGVTAKKTSPKIPEQFLKFVDGPKFTRPSYQDVSYRNEFTGSTGTEPPKVLRTSSFRNDYRNQNRIQSLPSSYYPSPFYNQKSKPYTMMLPPPLAQKDNIVSFVEPTRQFNTQTEEGPALQDSQFYASAPPSKNYNQQGQSSSKFGPGKGAGHTVSQVETIKSVHAPSSPHPSKSKYEGSITPSVSFEKSNLIYQSTQTLSAGWPSNSNGIHLSTPTTSIGSQPTTRLTPDYSRDQYEIDHHVAASSNHEVVVEQNANIIVDGGGNGNEEVVVGQKGMPKTSATVSSSSSPPSIATTTEALRSSFPSSPTSSLASSLIDEKVNAAGESETGQTLEKMHIVVANSPVSSDIETPEAKKGPVTVVMPANYSEKKPNHVSRDTQTPGTPGTPETRGVESTTIVGTRIAGEVGHKSESQVVENSMTTGPPHFPGVSQSIAVAPNRMMPSQQQQQQHPVHGHSTMSPFPSRHPLVDSMLPFGHPQAPLSSMMHPQARPSHGSMHFLGSMRPSVGFRLPASMPMFPPMTHMHAPPPPPPPVGSTINHMGSPTALDHQPANRMPQFHPDFPAVFTISPAPSTSYAQSNRPEDRFVDRHRSRQPDTTTSIFTTPTASPFLPTVRSTIENSPLAVRDPESVDRSPPRTAWPASEQEQDERETDRKNAPPESSVTRSTASATSQVTTVSSLTTDPIFSHYKQPAKPIRGPMYLIIQGHSKVKTYKPTVSKHGTPTGRNEIAGSVGDSQLSMFEQFVQETTRNNDRANAVAVEKKKAEEKARIEKLARVRQGDLMSLVENGFESFTASPSYPTTEDEPRANSVTAVEIDGN